MSSIRQVRTKGYKRVIEIAVPVRFFWDNESYDGFEFGPLDKCSNYQLKLFKDVVRQLSREHEALTIVEYMATHHKDEWQAILNKIDAESSGIPQTFLDAFKDDEEKNE